MLIMETSSLLGLRKENTAFFALFFFLVVEQSTAFLVSAEKETTTTAAGRSTDGKSSSGSGARSNTSCHCSDSWRLERNGHRFQNETAFEFPFDIIRRLRAACSEVYFLLVVIIICFGENAGRCNQNHETGKQELHSWISFSRKMMKQCWMTTRVGKIPRCMLQNVWLYDAEVSSLYSIFGRGSIGLIQNL